MEKQDKRAMNHWLRTIKTQLADLTLIVDNFDLAINFNERMAQDKPVAKGTICTACGSVKPLSGLQGSNYFWVNNSAHRGEYRFFYRHPREEGVKNILMEVLKFNRKKGKWVCAGDSSSQEYETPFRLIALVNIKRIPKGDVLSYRRFCREHICRIGEEQVNILNESSEVNGNIL